MRFGDYLVALLERHGVTHIFGIPGVHTAELYRGLAGSGIRHITPRHEQGAGFMADGYARVSGKPGVCFVITGPGVTNIATAMAQAHQDSIPMVVISSVNRTNALGHQYGHLHELRDQQALASELTAFSHTLLKPDDLPAVLDRAFAVFNAGRPRPVHISIPIDVMESELPSSRTCAAATIAASAASDASLAQAVALLDEARRPTLLLGGGARSAALDLVALAERLDAPAVMTVNARGLLPRGHALALSASPSLEAVRKLTAESDVVLAIGTEFGPTDYDMYSRGAFVIPGTLIRVEIDPVQSMRNRAPDVALIGDAGEAVRALRGGLGSRRKEAEGAARAKAAREAAFRELSPAMQRQVEFLNMVRDALPNAVIVGDSTKPVYAGNLFFEAAEGVSWFNSATGYGTLGYALPAAIGAKLAAPERPVVCLVGDGGLQFVLGELGSAIDAGAPVIVLVWNNRGYGEIKSYFEENGIAPIGVDVTPPDFVAVARAYGWAAERLSDRDSLPGLLREAATRTTPTLIDIDERVADGR
jgi:acetolactate synthase I/II/III large subunit